MNRNPATVPAGVRRIGLITARGYGRFDRLLIACAALAFLVTAASGLARAGWLFELLTHFRFQVAAGAMLLLACALVRRRLLAAALAAIALGANAAPLLPYVLGSGLDTAIAAGGFELMSANVRYSNEDYGALIEQVREVSPDVLALLEVDQTWLEGIAALEEEYPWSVRYPEEGAWGLALYSRLPMRELPASPYVEAGIKTAILVELELAGKPLKLVAAHVSSPVTPAKARLRNVQLAKIAELLRPDGRAQRVLLGDLNVTPWSPYYEDLTTHASLSNAARGFGYLPTWPAGINPVKIPIDHCLVSDDLRVLSFRTGSAFGSDHLPVIVELAGLDEAT